MSEALIDRQQLDLICDECAAEVADIFRDFVAETPDQLAQLRGLAAASDREALGKLAHRIKGGSSTFGLLRFSSQLIAIERETAEGRLPGEPELAEIERTFSESIRQIREWRPELA